MEKNTNQYNEIKTKLESCFKELNYKYSLVDLNDNDLNYEVSIDSSYFFKSMSNIQGIFYACIGDNTITLTIPNIYYLDKKKDLNHLYRIINDINSLLNHGRFLIKENLNHIVYSSSINCGENFSELTTMKIKSLSDDFFNNLIKLIAIFLKEKI